MISDCSDWEEGENVAPVSSKVAVSKRIFSP